MPLNLRGARNLAIYSNAVITVLVQVRPLGDPTEKRGLARGIKLAEGGSKELPILRARLGFEERVAVDQDASCHGKV